jgi:hypothetical protein
MDNKKQNEQLDRITKEFNAEAWRAVGVMLVIDFVISVGVILWRM